MSRPAATGQTAMGMPSAPPSPAADPFAHLRPEDLILAQHGMQASRPRRPRPALSPVTRAWINALLLSVVAAAVVLGGIWGTMIAYQSYRSNATRQEALGHEKVAEQAFNRGDYPQAIREFQSAAQISPGSDVGRAARHNAVNATLAMASQQQSRGDVAGAEGTYLAAIRLDPENAKAHAWLAALLFNQGQRNQASDYWDRAIMLWNQQLQRGTLDANEVQDARQGLAQAEQNYGRALLIQAEELASQRRTTEAISFWQRVILVSPGSPEARTAQSRLDTVGSAGTGIFPSYMGAAP